MRIYIVVFFLALGSLADAQTKSFKKSPLLSDQLQGLRGDGLNRYSGLAFSIKEIGVAEGGMGSAGALAGAGHFNTNCFADKQEGFLGILMKQTRGDITDNTGCKFRLLMGQAVDD